MNLVKQLLVDRKLRVQWGSGYPSNTQMLLHVIVWGYLRGVTVKAMDCGIVVSEFVLQSRYYVDFRANTLGKGMNPPIYPPNHGLNSTTTVLLGEWLWH